MILRLQPFDFVLKITCPANVCNHNKKIFNGVFALNARCDHKRWAPIVTPSPEPYINANA